MAYIKNNWVDREGTTRYFESVDTDGAKIFTPDYTQVTELGTPVNADNMNHIEEGIAAGSFTKFDLNTTYAKNDLVTVIEDSSPVIYKSLLDNNIGNALSSSEAWEKISLGGGGGGLEIGDIGIAPLGIDETKGKRRYLNGQVIIQEQYVQFANKVKSAVALYPSLACTESEWQTIATMTVGGQVGKFVIDDEQGTIRLPKIIMPIQGLTDLSKLGEIVEAGLPNITGEFVPSSGVYTSANTDSSSTGALVSNYIGLGCGTGKAAACHTLTFNASKSNSTYGNSNTVQQEQIQYPYFIQVATGAETEDNIINEIELNNPFSLLDYKYSEYELNNISWLRSNGQYNSKAIYPAVYDLLLKIYNGTETKAGVSVKLSTQSFTDYDFVLNTADETFRLPIKTKNAPFTVNGTANVDVYGNGINPRLYEAGSGAYVYPAQIGVTSYNGTDGSSGAWLYEYGKANTSFKFSSNPAQSGLTGKATISTSENTNVSLYFYVGETVQNANLVNVGRIEEKIVDIQTELPHKLNDTQITNCISEIPQRIKLELNDGVLTLKAGSQVIIPNGFEEDGVTPKFDYVTVENDVSLPSNSNFINSTVFIFFRKTDNILIFCDPLTQAFSGTTEPTSTIVRYWLDTTTNLMKVTANSGQTWSIGETSLPLCILNVDASADTITSIDQVFNGFGYIGSTVWVDKGVKFLVTNGRNQDGTLNNIECISPKILTCDASNSFSAAQVLMVMVQNDNMLGFVSASRYSSVNTLPSTVSNTYYHLYYNITENKHYKTSGSTTANWVEIPKCIVGDVYFDGTNLSSFNPKQPFRAVDYGEFTDNIVKKLDSSAVKAYIKETYVNGTSWYRIYSDGWIEQGGTTGTISSGTKTTYLKSFTNTNYSLTTSLMGSSYRDQAPSMVKATNGFTIYHNAGLNNGLGWSWYACGY